MPGLDVQSSTKAVGGRRRVFAVKRAWRLGSYKKEEAKVPEEVPEEVQEMKNNTYIINTPNPSPPNTN